MKISEFLAKNDQKPQLSKQDIMIRSIIRIAFYILLTVMFGKAVYGIVLGMRLTQKILFPF